MPKSYFDSLNHFIQKRYKWVIAAWVVAVLISLVLIPSFFSSVSYDLTGGFGAPPNTEADKAANIVNAQFPSSNASDQSILVVIQNASVYSDALRQNVLSLNQTLSKDPNIGNYTGQESLYSLEASLLNESLPEIISQTAGLQSNIATINSGLYSLQDNLSSLSTNLFQLQSGINQTAQLVYGVPAAFAGVWQGITAQGVTDPNVANMEANATTFNVTSNFGGDAQSIAYYSAFFTAWSASFQALPNSTTLLDRETFAINQSVTAFLSNPQLDSQTSQTLILAASSLNVTTWNQRKAIANLTISAMASSIPADLSASLGASPITLVNELYSLGSSPSNATLGTYAIAVLEASYSNMTTLAQDFRFQI